jgi:hypothetical protein
MLGGNARGTSSLFIIFDSLHRMYERHVLGCRLVGHPSNRPQTIQCMGDSMDILCQYDIKLKVLQKKGLRT